MRRRGLTGGDTPATAAYAPRAASGRDARARMDLALFDFDGTITTRETMPDFMAAAVPGWRRRPGYALLLPLIAGYRRGRVSGTTVRRAIVAIGFAGVRATGVDAAGDAFARKVIPGLVRTEAMARIDAHRRRGDTVVVVSGGLDVYLRPWAQTEGLPLLCSALERRGNRLTGRYAGEQCVGAEKPLRVRRAYDIETFTRIHAYGDTREDDAMLAMAHHAHYRCIPDDVLDGPDAA